MPRRYQRSASVEVVAAGGVLTVSTLLGRGLRIAWDVTKSLTPEANRATVRIFNLNRLSRATVEGIVTQQLSFTPEQRLILAAAGASAADPVVTTTSLGGAHMTLRVGHGPVPLQIFEGRTSHIASEHDRVDWITKLDAGDGLDGLREARISQTFAPGTPIEPVVAALVASMGVQMSPAALPLVRAAATAKATETSFPKGFTVYGRAYDHLAEMLRLLEVKWSIQDGVFHVYDSLGALPFPPIVLNQATGLIGSPGRLPDDGVRADALLDPRLQPAQAVVLQSRSVAGTYRVETVQHVGDTHGAEAVSRLELSPLSPIPGVL